MGVVFAIEPNIKENKYVTATITKQHLSIDNFTPYFYCHTNVNILT